MKYAEVLNVAGLRGADAEQRWGNAMIKDIIVNLTVDASHDVAADYAISVARAFEAHLAGIASRTSWSSPAPCSGASPSSLIQAHRAEEKKRREPRSLISTRRPAASDCRRNRASRRLSGRGGEHVRPDRASLRSFGGRRRPRHRSSRAET